MPTPHNTGKIEDFAKTILMPGDPLRAKFIAETFLTDPVLVNNVRGVQGYTGTWKGVPVTVMASGMGMPSIGIYSWELFNFYEVENIIRIGSAGALQDDVKLREIVAGQAACTNSNYAKNFGLGEASNFAPIADYTLLSTAVEAAKEHGVTMRVGNLLSSDTFYLPEGCAKNDQWKQMGVLAIEMESAALYTNAAYAGKRALCICTISDHIYRPEDNLSAEDRQNSFTQMMEIALDTAVKMAALG
ncbi:MAG: purine-nucleoside phosphorylase [Oscillospiraceae bacterium]|nr:purine-nucleoside phosphorylase [Oscillospiraceae bacterium]